MTKKELVEWVSNDVTLSGSLSINIPDAEIERQIEVETKQLQEIYPDMLQDVYTILHPDIFHSKEFRQNRTIQFPSCIKSIIKFEELKHRGAWLGWNEGDMGFNRAFMSDFYFTAPFNTDVITYRTLTASVWDQMRAWTLVDITFSYNRNTHKLIVLGHDPRVPVFCEMMSTIPDEDAWEDPWVRKWISAKCKLAVQRLIGTFTTNLVGGVTINSQMYADQAQADLTECKDYFKEINQGSYWLDFPS